MLSLKGPYVSIPLVARFIKEQDLDADEVILAATAIQAEERGVTPLSIIEEHLQTAPDYDVAESVAAILKYHT